MSDALRIQQLAEELGGGWRIEYGFLPMVVLTEREAETMQTRLADLEAECDDLRKRVANDFDKAVIMHDENERLRVLVKRYTGFWPDELPREADAG